MNECGLFINFIWMMSHDALVVHAHWEFNSILKFVIYCFILSFCLYRGGKKKNIRGMFCEETFFLKAGRVPFHRQAGLKPPVFKRSRSSGGGCLYEVWRTFFITQSPWLSAASSYRSWMNHMVGSKAHVDTIRTYPLDYCVTRSDYQYAIELLSCTAGSVFSDCTFSMVRNFFFTDKKSQTVPDTVNQLTWWKWTCLGSIAITKPMLQVSKIKFVFHSGPKNCFSVQPNASPFITAGQQ